MFEKIGFSELAIILVVALLIFGPSKLPTLGKSIGESIREFKKSMKEISADVAGEDKQA
jgi:sec-independent protein translocase protein TatA